MPRYNVSLAEKVEYVVTVDAETEEEAYEIACDLWVQSPDPTHDFCGEGQGVTARFALTARDDEPLSTVSEAKP